MSWDTVFTFDTANPTLSNVKMMPKDDNFDFKSAGLADTEIFNRWALKDQFDRFNIDKSVDFDYQGRELVTGMPVYAKEDNLKQMVDFEQWNASWAMGVTGGVATQGYVKYNHYNNDIT